MVLGLGLGLDLDLVPDFVVGLNLKIGVQAHGKKNTKG